MSRVNIEVKDAVHKRFMDQCDEDGRSVSDVIRTLILDFVERRIREKQKLAEIEEKNKEGREDAGRKAETG